jgi:hypothetical protein
MNDGQGRAAAIQQAPSGLAPSGPSSHPAADDRGDRMTRLEPPPWTR